MSIKIKLITAAGALVLLTGCHSTTIYPKGNNSYSSVTTGSNLGYAESDAKGQTEAECKKQGKHLALINHETSYHGADTQTKVIGGIVGGLLLGFNPAISNDDYVVKTQFRCA